MAKVASSDGGDVLPHRTLYIRNLDDRVQKTVQKRNLYLLFTEFGKVEKVLVGTGQKLRGQAWVTFAETTSAIEALRRRQGSPYFL